VVGHAAVPNAFGSTPGTYTYYAAPVPAVWLHDVTFGTTVTSDPGRGNVFWSHQFAFNNNVGGYIGMQRLRGGGGLFLFSMWNSTAAMPGDAGTWCETFSENGSGYTCRESAAFVAGDSYTFHITPDPMDGWFAASVTDTTAQTSFTLGHLEVGSGAAIDPANMIAWVEYFDWNNPAATCEDEPYSAARFAVPTGHDSCGNAIIEADQTSSLSSACPSSVKVEIESADSVHEDGIGNSPSGSIVGIGGKCVDVRGGGSADGTPLELWPCTGNDNQNWVLASDGTIHALFKCMTVAGTAVQLATCTGSATQQWQLANGALVNPATGMCLDVTGGSSTDGTLLEIYGCTGNVNQKWTAPQGS
jgi:hypothetical protein